MTPILGFILYVFSHVDKTQNGFTLVTLFTFKHETGSNSGDGGDGLEDALQ